MSPTSKTSNLKPMGSDVPEEKETWGHRIQRLVRETWFRVLGIHGYITLKFTTDAKLILSRKMSYSTPSETLSYSAELHNGIVRIIEMLNQLSEQGMTINDLKVMLQETMAHSCETCPGAELAGMEQAKAQLVDKILSPFVSPNTPVTIETLTRGVKF
jgi:hypothetical protein